MHITNKILIDEMDDGMDEKLNSLGYDAYSIKKLRAEGKKLHTDYSVINYAKENNMILITRCLLYTSPSPRDRG